MAMYKEHFVSIQKFANSLISPSDIGRCYIPNKIESGFSAVQFKSRIATNLFDSGTVQHSTIKSCRMQTSFCFSVSKQKLTVTEVDSYSQLSYFYDFVRGCKNYMEKAQ